MNMTAKQWAARAVMAAAMAAGLSACGGGGDSAAPAVAPTPEELTAGLTIKESTINRMDKNSYQMRLTAAGVKDTGSTIEYIASSPAPNRFFLGISYDKTTKQVRKVVLQTLPSSDFVQAGCGYSDFACDNSHITIDPLSSQIKVSSLVLKELTSPGTDLASVMTDPKTAVASPAGSLTVSGVMTLIP
jgi:hypothetical protein